jgi:hypothetical protein
VGEETLALYKKFNHPFQQFVRYCPCNASIAALVLPVLDKEARTSENLTKRVDGLTQAIQVYLKHDKSRLSRECATAVRVFKQEAKAWVAFVVDMVERGVSDDRFGQMMVNGPLEMLMSLTDVLVSVRDAPSDSKKRTKDDGEEDKHKALCALLNGFAELEVRPERWRRMQFYTVAKFPQVYCGSCQAQHCLQCGEASHHPNTTCREHLEHVCAELESQRPTKRRKTTHVDRIPDIKYRLERTRPCPGCRVLIERDDGCNRVDCLYCGERFCWQCAGPWSKKCGFYACGETPLLPKLTREPTDHVEIGVPDVKRLLRPR